ncbi:hypothetical protein [Bradyrhizobium sp. CCBAU 53380]|uniref:hypothetical protein n=1 Tax=Bradyrhizobium sp. CCBAU 53380 TaxID=1325117 RepID=UPI002304B1C9|nr:hypothetical protein [Bradyrhizobium sp. CCBAU 53380]MDA9422910.1 hypothetical protein [Bradyrhizobium sp. CCBAU 53380]
MRGIRAISIDPAAQSITAIEISPETRFVSSFFGSKPKVAAKLPKGDALLTTVREYGEAFTVGGSRPVVGPGLIVGRRNGPGDRASVRIALADVVTMVRWTSVEMPPRPVLPPPPASVRAIVLDPKLGIVEQAVIAAHMPAAERLLGGVHDWNMRILSGDYLLSAKTGRNYRWWVRLYGEVKLIGRCVIVGVDEETGYFADAAVRLEQLRKQVDFRGPEDKLWVRYSDRQTTAAPAAAE